MKLSYGKHNACDIPRADAISIGPSSMPMIPRQEVAGWVRHALSSPLDFPDLASSTVPGDMVVLAIQYGIPLVQNVVQGALDALGHAGIESSSITVLITSQFAADSAALRELKEVIRDSAKLVIHSAEDDELALLGITNSERLLRLNRVLCDADLVIPIGVTKSPERTDVVDSLLAAFSDTQTLRRFHSPLSHETDATRQKLEHEVAECLWMLGVNLTLQVVPGPRSEIATVYCGTPEGVQRAAQETFHELWAQGVEARSDLVMASIVGDSAQQTWQNVSRALSLAEELLEPGGAIAICTEMATRPGPSVNRLQDAPDLMEVERKLLKDDFPDSLSALTLCRSLQRGTVYLKSRLDPSLVESLGLAPINSEQELERLTHRYRRCLVLEEAQYLFPNPNLNS